MPSRRRVGSVMTTDVTTVGPDTPFKASVHNGIVTLVRRVDGVVEVRQTLQARFDDRGVSPTPSGPAGVLSRKPPTY